MAWLASSDAEIARARTVLRSLSQSGVLDELGFLVLLGAFSDRLYPAITTIMTRPRYLVFLPAMFRYLEEKRIAKNRNADAVSRQLQFELRNALVETNPKDEGIIGLQSGRSLARVPSNIYWNALADLGIARERIPELSYLDRLSGASANADRVKDDDGTVHSGDSEGFWDRAFHTDGVVTQKGEFVKGTSLLLTGVEALLLRQRYQELRPDGGTSLLTHLIDRGANNEGNTVFDFPWDVPGLPADLRLVIDHAKRLSLLVRGASIQYDALLFEAKKVPDAGTREAFIAWYKHSYRILADWDLAAFATLPCAARGRSGDITFIAEWRNSLVSATSPSAAYSAASSRELLRVREWNMRGGKARLKSKYHLRTWKEPKSYDPNAHYGLRFRHPVATRFAVDIAAGLRTRSR